MDLITWDSEYDTDIELVDAQHKTLCSIINKLGTAMDDNKEKSIIVNIVDELIDYTKYHFSMEEEYFEEFDFEGKEEHIEEHEYFINYFTKIKENINENLLEEASSDKLSMDILKYLVAWFVSHITGTDRKYIELFKKNGIV